MTPAVPTTAATAPTPSAPLGRRSLLKAAAFGAALGGVGSLAAPAQAAAPQGRPGRGPRFDLRAASTPLLLGARLHDAHRIMQSFAFDDVNQRLFVAQLQNASSGDDLCISQLDLQGNLRGWMHLDGVGHGVSIGVEAVGTRSFLWTETRSSASHQGGRGTALQRFEFVSGSSPVDAQVFLPRSAVITCSVDQQHSQLLVRRFVGRRWELTVHDLSAAAQGDFSDPLRRFTMPGISGVFQGYALHGDHVYVLTGRGHTDPRHIDSQLNSVDVRTGRLVEKGVRTWAGRSLLWREPEGVAVHRTPDGQTRLCFGLASHDPEDRRVRLANIYAKDVLVG